MDAVRARILDLYFEEQPVTLVLEVKVSGKHMEGARQYMIRRLQEPIVVPKEGLQVHMNFEQIGQTHFLSCNKLTDLVHVLIMETFFRELNEHWNPKGVQFDYELLHPLEFLDV